MITYILALLSGAVVVCLDQYTKYHISANYLPIEVAEPKPFIPKILNIGYLENTGAAWGMLKDHTWLLISITMVVMLVCLTLILRYGTKNKLFFWAMVFVLSGGIGNMIDRIFKGGRVVDFLQFDFWKSFPMFNIADCAIVLGAGFFVLYFVLDLWGEMKSRSARKHIPKINSDEKS